VALGFGVDVKVGREVGVAVGGIGVGDGVFVGEEVFIDIVVLFPLFICPQPVVPS
jgi:hypothetical protein